MSSIGRREFLGLSAAAAVAALEAVNFVANPPAGAEFVAKRTYWSGQRRSYSPRNLHDTLPRTDTDKIYKQLELDKHHPKTLNPDAFYAIAQRPAALANRWFDPEDKSFDEQERNFATHSAGFFGRIQKWSQFLETDFVATMLMFQVSSEATPTQRTLEADLREEVARAGLGVLRGLTGSELTKAMINVMRIDTDKIPFLIWPVARLDGQVTLGIHDIENSVVAEALDDIKETLPQKWETVEDFLQKSSPKYPDQYRDIAAKNAAFDAKTAEIISTVNNAPGLKSYLEKFNNPDFIKDFLLEEDGTIDAYQFMRTTTLWASINQLSTHAGSRVPGKRILEDRALTYAIDHYMKQNSPIPFFLDQICNPKLVAQLEQDASEGNKAAQELLSFSTSFAEIGDSVLTADRVLSDTIVHDKLEQNLDFQVMTGVAYARHLLRRAHVYSHPRQSEMASNYEDPNELLFDAFLGNGIRENSAIFELAGTGPHHSATDVYNPYKKEFNIMGDFVDQLYLKFHDKHPQQDFKTFLRSLRMLLRENESNLRFGFPSGDLEPGSKAAHFTKEAEQFGVFNKILVPPHISWVRGMGATQDYTTTMLSK